MSGAGNDFVVLGATEASGLGPRLATWVRAVCRRGLSVGADGVLVVEPSGDNRVTARFFNPDGTEAFCGNASRCAARFAVSRGMVQGNSMVLETAIGDVDAQVRGPSVLLTLPPPADLGCILVETERGGLEGRGILAGVPHFVVWAEEVGSFPLNEWGPLVRRHARFAPEGTNLDVAAPHGDGAIAVRTWERGVEGETLACGTGAVAVALAARLKGKEETVRILPASLVPLVVTLPGPADAPKRTLLEGDARIVFEGVLSDEGTEGFPT